MGQDNSGDLMYSILEDDYKDVKTQLKKQFNFIPAQTQEKSLNSLHKWIFCLCNLVYGLSKIDNERLEFLHELHSDSIQLLVLVPLGLKKSIFLALRSCIEDTLKYLYYKDHPIELI